MKIYLSHSSAIDYKTELYEPIKNSELMKNNEFFFPHEAEAINTKNLLPTFDLVVAEVSVPTTGQGIELGWADVFGVPILCIFKKGVKISSAIGLLTKNVAEYTNSRDMINKIKFAIENIK